MARATESEPATREDRPHPRGGVFALVAALAVLLFGGAALGAGLADRLAPGSWLAQAVGVFALPLAFATGLQMWVGVAIVGGLARLLLGRRRSPNARRETVRALPGSFVFLPLGSGAGLCAGVIVALVPSAHSALLTIAAYWLAGTLHGWLAWQLARHGVLVPPEGT